MPRGGARPGAGRKPKPKPEIAKPEGFTDGEGVRADTAPADWPFGTKSPDPAEPSAEPAAAAPVVTPLADVKPQTAHEFLKGLYQDAAEDVRVRIQAAVAALPYEEAKLMPKGKRGDKAAPGGVDKAAGPSRFGALAPPRLVSSRT